MNNFQVDEVRDLNANIVAIDSHQGTGIVYASLFGYTVSTKNIIKSIKNRKCTLRMQGRVYQSDPEDYAYYSSKITNSDFSHTIIYKKDKVYKNPEVKINPICPALKGNNGIFSSSNILEF